MPFAKALKVFFLVYSVGFAGLASLFVIASQ